LESLPQNLRFFQSPSGGFVDYNDTAVHATADATADALHLTALFSLGSRINFTAAAEYVASLHDAASGGYLADRASASASISSTRSALLTLAYVGLAPVDGASLGAYVSAEFVSAVAEKRVGDALAALDCGSLIGLNLGAEEEGAVGEAAEALSDYLSEHASADDGQVAYFEDASSSLSPLALNRALIEVARYIDFDLGALSAWAEHVVRQQDKASGCFFSGASGAPSSAEAAIDAVHALHTLQASQEEGSKLNFVDLVDFEALHRCLASSTAERVSAVSAAQRALSLTSAGFARNVRVEPSYERASAAGSTLPGAEGPTGEQLVGESIVQGTVFYPMLSVRTPFGAHAALQARLVIDYGEAQPKYVEMDFDPDAMQYQAFDAFDTDGVLGQANFYYSLVQQFPLIGALRREATDAKLIGYAVEVDARAVIGATGREVEVGGSVVPFTDFAFGVDVQAAERDFVLHFAVTDSSGVVLHSDQIDGAELALDEDDDEAADDAELRFEYSLSRVDLPSGALFFLFNVDGARAGGMPFTHTRTSVRYELDVSLVAAQISIEGGDERGHFKIGDHVSVGIEPAAFADRRTVTPLAHDDSARRRFALDVVSAGGIAVATVGGELAAADDGSGNVHCLFEFVVPASLDAIGAFSLRFRYLAAVDGRSFELAPYDSERGELFDNADADVAIVVDAELRFDDGGAAPAKAYSYGDRVDWSFGIVDSLSGLAVHPAGRGASEGVSAGVFLTLSHAPDAFVSAHVPVARSASDGRFAVSWTVSANSIAGDATLAIVAEDADGNALPLGGGASSHRVTVGGRIDSDSFTHATKSLTAQQTAYIAVFKLSCNSKPLSDAKLAADVYRDGVALSEHSRLPVATTPNGAYAVSWTTDVDNAVTGLYEIRLIRDVDRLRAQASADAQPNALLIVNIEHHNLGDGKLPIPTEIFVLFVLVVVFFKLVTLYSTKKHVHRG
jgi:Translocon-associated protein, delta subunit precursor (TRAP-delta)